MAEFPGLAARERPNHDATMPRWFLIVLVVLNAVVLFGQIWPGGAPPMARGVNITFLALSLATFAWMLGRRKGR